MISGLNNKVYLVGAGPGDPRLLTLRAQDLISRADVILYDYLVHPNCLGHAKKGALITCVGKKKGAHSHGQEDINQKIKSYFDKGNSVLRLKGGDPMVFGRVGEEMGFLQQQNIPFEVVPGVSSASAVPAYANIPITHRDHARSVAFVTGTLKTGDGLDDIHIPQADTLVFLMGITHLKTLVEKVLTNTSFTINTPAALIYKGTSSDQRTVVGTLQNINTLKQEKLITHPSILLVGGVAKLGAEKCWFEQLPLFGKRLINLRPTLQPAIFSEFGAEEVLCPILEICPKETELNSIDVPLIIQSTLLIFTSQNASRLFFEKLSQLGLDARTLSGKKIIAIGPKTKASLRPYGVIADAMPSTYSQKGILALLDQDLSQEKVLLPISEKRNPLLENSLQNRGATLNLKAIYTTRPQSPPHISLQDGDYIIFSSLAVAKAFYQADLYSGQAIHALCFSASIADYVRKFKPRSVHISTAPTQESLLELMLTMPRT